MKSNLSCAIALFAVLLLSSCYSTKKITYFNDLRDSSAWSAPITNYIQPKFQKDDRISVEVRTIDKGTSDFLNSGAIINSSAGTSGEGSTGQSSKEKGYVVDEKGDIYLPFIGKIHAEGLTKMELKEAITREISKYVKNPIVYVEWLNFKYTVIGETKGTGVYELEGDRMNVIQAVAKAGDFNKTAEMDNVMLIREENGERKMVKLDFQSSELLNSPYFYIQQNDILYLTPSKYADQKPQNQIRQLTLLSTITALSGTIIGIISLTRK